MFRGMQPLLLDVREDIDTTQGKKMRPQKEEVPDGWWGDISPPPPPPPPSARKDAGE